MKSIQHGTPFLFADDVKIVYAFRPSLTDIYVQRIQEDLNSLTLWSRYSGLSFSAQKCQLMAYRCRLAEHAITLCNSRIPLVSYTKDLGIRYTCHFDFSTQALHQVAKARQLTFLILRSFHITASMVALYKQQVRPILEFCPFISTLFQKSLRIAIEGVQRRFTKAFFPSDNRPTYRARCTLLRLEPLWLRRLKLNLVFLHQLIYKHSHIALWRPSFAPNLTYNLRNTQWTVSINRSRTDFHRYSFLNYYSRIWNKLPISLRSEEEPLAFKRQLRAFLSLDTISRLWSLQLSEDTLFECGPPRI